MPGTDRRGSTSSEDASLPSTRQIITDSLELIPTRTTKTAAPKPAANPLQFIKVGPCDLYKAAQEQLKKVEEIKKVEKTVKEESEDWQSNLDNWKCSRRKRQEHIIDRVVEVKKLELEEHERNKRRGKTLSEMIQERSDKGVGPRKMSLLTYPDEDPSDLTDLGISLTDKNNGMQDEEHSTTTTHVVDSQAEQFPNRATNRKASPVSNDNEEYTYERAIQGYKSFAEKNVKSSSKPPKPGGRIDEKLQELEQVRFRSNSVCDVNLPKVDIHKRRSLFEVVESAETKSPSAERIAKDLGGATIVKQRLSSLERQPEASPVSVTRVVDEIGPTLKDRLGTLEKHNIENDSPRVSIEEIARVSIKERLSSLERGCKESVMSSCSDEELGHKELLSPAVSDREVSSPLVSRNNLLTHNDDHLPVGVDYTNTEVDDGQTNILPLVEGIARDIIKLDEEVHCVKQPASESSTIFPHPKLTEDQTFKELIETKTEKCQHTTSLSPVVLQLSDLGLNISEKSSDAQCTGVKGPKPVLRIRKLTPFLKSPLSPTESQPAGELPVITEDMSSTNNELLAISQEMDTGPAPKPTPRPSTLQGAETSESGIDMEESSLYTDENIDEVLGEDVDDDIDYDTNRDAHDVPDSASDLHRMRRLVDQPRQAPALNYIHPTAQDEAVTRFGEAVEIAYGKSSATKELFKEQESVARLDQLLTTATAQNNSGIASQEKCVEDMASRRLSLEPCSDNDEQLPVESTLNVKLSTKQNQSVNNYENIGTVNQMLELSNNGEVVLFPLSPTSSVEPPKEKPPPPPIDESDDEEEEEAPALPPKASVRRIDSTKRIKKEIRKKRSDFLGIEGVHDDVCLEPELEPPPDMLALLEEERRLDQQLYRQSIASDADSAEGTHIIRKNISVEKPLLADQTLYRQSICSETDSNHETTESRDSGVELDRANSDDVYLNKSFQLHSRDNSETYPNSNGTTDEDEIAKKEREIIEVLENEEKWRFVKSFSASDDKLAEKLRLLEEEKMRLEWARAEEEGRRMADEERLQAKETFLRQQENVASTNNPASSQENLKAERERLELEQLELVRVRQDLLTQQQRPAGRPVQGPISTNLRYSMPNLQDASPPPPNPRPSSSWSRIPSTENLLDHTRFPQQHNQQQQQQMTRTALHALSATPRPRIVNGEAWMQPKRKNDTPKGAYNYQHWLIQEAEHRRITEQNQRAVQSRRSLPNHSRPHVVIPAASHHPSPPRPLSGHLAQTSPVQHVAYSNVPTIHSHTHNVPPPSHHNVVGLPPAPHAHPYNAGKPLPDAIIQTLTQRVQHKTSPKTRTEDRPSKQVNAESPYLNGEQERMLSVSGKKKCSHCGDELGRGAAMVIESLRLFYHIDCFKCCVCHSQLGDGLMGTDVRVRNNKLHCHNCYSSDDGVKFSCV